MLLLSLRRYLQRLDFSCVKGWVPPGKSSYDNEAAESTKKATEGDAAVEKSRGNGLIDVDIIHINHGGNGDGTEVGEAVPEVAKS